MLMALQEQEKASQEIDTLLKAAAKDGKLEKVCRPCQCWCAILLTTALPGNQTGLNPVALQVYKIIDDEGESFSERNVRLLNVPR